jgi:periplasmic mercuric ion binding protein
MKSLLVAVFISLATFNQSVLAAPQTLKVNVNGMVCAFCAQGIEKKVRALPQTEDVYVNLKQHVVAIALKEGQTISDETIKSLIKNAGYEVTAITLSAHPLTHIKAVMEAPGEDKK